jgi:hypothetical protein
LEEFDIEVLLEEKEKIKAVKQLHDDIRENVQKIIFIKEFV